MLESKINVFCKKMLGSTQGVVEAHLTNKDGEIKKVLTSCCDVFVNSFECLKGEVTLNGRGNLKCVVLDENDTAQSLNVNADFSIKFCDASILPSSKLEFDCVVVDLTASDVLNGNTILMRAVVETAVFLNENKTCDTVDCNDFSTKKQSISVCEVQKNIDQCFSVIEEVSTKENIGKILMAQSTAIVTNATSSIEMVTVEGEIFCNVVFMTADKKIVSQTFEIPFSEEIDVPNCNENSIALLRATAKNTRVHLEMMEEGASKQFALECEICLRGNCFGVSQKSLVCDAFSVTNELKVSAEKIELCMPRKPICFVDKVSAMLTLEEHLKVEKVLAATNPKLMIVSASIGDGQLTVEGIVIATVLFCADEQTKSTNIEAPFVICHALDNVSAKSQVELSGALVEVVCQKGKKGDLEINALVKICAHIFEKNTCNCVTNMEIGQPKLVKDVAIEVVSGKAGMMFWDLSKILNMPTEQIVKTNPHLTEPLPTDSKVIVFRKI